LDLGDITGGISGSQKDGLSWNLGWRIPITVVLLLIGIIGSTSLMAAIFGHSGNDIEISHFEVEENGKLFTKDSEIEVTATIVNHRPDAIRIHVVCNLTENGNQLDSQERDYTIEGKDSGKMEIVFDAEDGHEYEVTAKFYEVAEDGSYELIKTESEEVET